MDPMGTGTQGIRFVPYTSSETWCHRSYQMRMSLFWEGCKHFEASNDDTHVLVDDMSIIHPLFFVDNPRAFFLMLYMGTKKNLANPENASGVFIPILWIKAFETWPGPSGRESFGESLEMWSFNDQSTYPHVRYPHEKQSLNKGL